MEDSWLVAVDLSVKFSFWLKNIFMLLCYTISSLAILIPVKLWIFFSDTWKEIFHVITKKSNAIT